jgi:hypothetical protein
VKRPQLIGAALLLAATLHAAHGQTPSEPPPPDSGTVLFSRGTDSATPTPPAEPDAPILLGKDDPLAVTETERTALTFTGYDLDAHLTPASSSLAMRAGLVIRNSSASPLSRVALQISSTLRWEAVSLAGHALPVVSRLVETDADHTGAMNEAVVTLPQPLAPGVTLNLVALYSGTIALSTDRLDRTGAPPSEARAADWDTISADGSFLRGFGYVLWYPVSVPPLFFRDADRLFQTIGATKLRETSASVRLRLAVEYQGESPDAAFFCGRRETLKAISDNPNAPAADSPGVATANFAPETLGFRTPDLFITTRPPVQAGTTSNPDLLSAVTTQDSAVAAYSAAASEVEPLLTDWFGAHAQSPLYLIDHSGQPFEDDTLLIRPLTPNDPATVAAALAHSLTHAWIHSSHPWIDEGLAEFSRLLWLERTHGHEAAIAGLQDSYPSLARAEGASGPEAADEHAAPAQSSSSGDASTATRAPSPAGVSLIEATGEVFYRTKAAAVWWMLRGIVGDQALKQSLQSYRSDQRGDHDPQAFERTLEKFSHKDLRWFFNGWVYQDRGLPRLSIVNVTPSELKGRTGVADGWLIAIEVRNDGDAIADVPVTLRSASSTQTERLRIAGHSSASTRIVFAGTPEQVIVNDGSVPESGSAFHTRQLTLAAH